MLFREPTQEIAIGIERRLLSTLEKRAWLTPICRG